MTVAEKMLSEFDDEFALTRRFLLLVPADKLLWKPHTKSMELGRLAWHVAEFPEWTLAILNQNPLRMTEADAAKSAHGWEGKSPQEILARFDTNLSAARTALKSAPDKKMAERWKLQWEGKYVVDEPRQEAIDKWTFRHMAHHRAQLGVYLRLLGVALPGCYGPSADEMEVVPAAA
ncbi:MAG: DinB family protein [Acidobacteriota bacterium]